jgi:hypothetical protein
MSRLWIYSSIAFWTVTALPTHAQLSNFNGPVAGFLYDGGAHTVRPLLGVPGATYIAAPLLTGVDSASIAPGSKWAFVVRSGNGTFVHGLSDAARTVSAVAGLIPDVDRVVWNRTGSYALLYSAAGNQLQRVRLSDTSVSPDAPLDLSPWGQPSTLAIDPSGRQIAFGVVGSGLYLFQVGQSPALLSALVRPVAATFDDTGVRLYAADIDQQQIVEFDSGAGPTSFASLAQSDGSVLNPVGLAVSAGGAYLMLADSTSRTVRVYNTDSQNLANTIPLDFAPTRLEALTSDPTFLLNDTDRKEWLLVLDARQTPAVYFVPAGQQE